MEDGCGSDPDCFPWLEDMERRRLADLELFARTNPDHEFPAEHREAMSRHLRSRSAAARLPQERAGAVASVRVPNKWCLATTLELLEVMRAFVKTNRVPLFGRGLQHWEAMAKGLSNPEGLDLTQLARSCQARISNIRRVIFAGKGYKIQAEILQSLDEFYESCELHSIPCSTRPTPRS